MDHHDYSNSLPCHRSCYSSGGRRMGPSFLYSYGGLGTGMTCSLSVAPLVMWDPWKPTPCSGNRYCWEVLLAWSSRGCLIEVQFRSHNYPLYRVSCSISCYFSKKCLYSRGRWNGIKAHWLWPIYITQLLECTSPFGLLVSLSKGKFVTKGAAYGSLD